MHSERREKTDYSTCWQGRPSGRCGNRRAGRGAKLGRAGCGARVGEEKGHVEWVGDWAGPNRPAAEEKERRKEEKGRDACAGRGEKEKVGPKTGVGPEWKKVIFFQKQKPFSKSIFSIFNSKPNSNRI